MPFLTLPASGSVAQAIKGRGLLTTVSFWTGELVSGDRLTGTPVVGALDARLLDSLDLCSDNNGVPGTVLATATVRPGYTDPLELLARFSTEVYLDPSVKQWLVWRAAPDADWNLAMGQAPNSAQAGTTALGYVTDVQQLSGSKWEALDRAEVPSIAFKLGTHPWQILHKECRRIECTLRYLRYEKAISTPDGREGPYGNFGSGPISKWWNENMSGMRGESFGWCEYCPYPPNIRQSPYNPPRFSCADAKQASSITNTIWPFTSYVPPGESEPIQIDPGSALMPIFGASESHQARYEGPDGKNGPLNFYVFADVGMASFNVGEVKNLRLFGRSPRLAPRLGVVSATVTQGGSGHSVGETIAVNSTAQDAPAVLRVDGVDQAGVIVVVSVQYPGRFVTPVGTATLGDATLALDYGLVEVKVLDGGEGFVSSDVQVFHVDPGAPTVTAELHTSLASDPGGGYKILSVTPVSTGTGYNALPQLQVKGTGVPDASCFATCTCRNDYDQFPGFYGHDNHAEIVGARIGLPAKAYIKVHALATSLVTPTPPPDIPYQTYNYTEDIATGDPRMKSTPAPPVKVTVPPSYQAFGSYFTLNRFVSTPVGAAHPTYDFSCPAAFGTTASQWTVTHLSVVVNRAGAWRY